MMPYRRQERLTAKNTYVQSEEHFAMSESTADHETMRNSDANNGARAGQSKTMLSESMQILEALLFASGEILPPSKLKEILPQPCDARTIRSMVAEINRHLQHQRHPFEIIEIGGGYQFRTVSYFHPWVRQIFKEKTSRKLSIQSLECLAIIAYKQPITKAEIESIRGVLSDGAMKTLLEKRLITVSGRSDKPGKPLLYTTTKDFLKHFGLNTLSDLPKIEEFEAIAKEKMEAFSEEELEQIDALVSDEGDEENSTPETESDEGNAPEAQSEDDHAGISENSAAESDSEEEADARE
jgi:segregation and condensation protein B